MIIYVYFGFCFFLLCLHFVSHSIRVDCYFVCSKFRVVLVHFLCGWCYYLWWFCVQKLHVCVCVLFQMPSRCHRSSCWRRRLFLLHEHTSHMQTCSGLIVSSALKPTQCAVCLSRRTNNLTILHTHSLHKPALHNLTHTVENWYNLQNIWSKSQWQHFIRQFAAVKGV